MYPRDKKEIEKSIDLIKKIDFLAFAIGLIISIIYISYHLYHILN